jgi:hypothetical protein
MANMKRRAAADSQADQAASKLGGRPPASPGESAASVAATSWGAADPVESQRHISRMQHSIWWIGGLAGLLILISLLGQLFGPWSGPQGKGLGSIGPRDWLAAIVFTAIGGRVAAHQPRNPIGWLLLAIGASDAIAVASGTYADAFIVVGWLRQWAWWPAYGLLPLVLLLFPDGRLPSRRWRLAAWAIGAGLIIPTLGLALAALDAPTDLVTSEGPKPHSGWAEAALFVVAFGLLLTAASWSAVIAGLVRRWRRARGDERQQLKWLLAASAVALIALALEFFMEGFWNQPSLWLTGAVGAAAVPAAVGVAVLKYHLYDIDRIINRTLVYALLTALLGAVYTGVVLVLVQISGGIATKPPSWAVASATLAVAALFQPARRRIQAAVDRRFNRRKYSATRTIEAYSVRLRDQLDLDTLSTELLAVVDQTMEPTRVSLWLRPSPPGSSGRARSAARPTTWAY